MSDDFWDDPDLQVETRVRFDKPGDWVAGKLIARRKVIYDDTPIPQFTLLDGAGNERVVDIGSIKLKREMVRLRPDLGDWIRIEMTTLSSLGGGKTMKDWAVEHRAADADVPF